MKTVTQLVKKMVQRYQSRWQFRVAFDEKNVGVSSKKAGWDVNTGTDGDVQPYEPEADAGLPLYPT